MSHARQVISLIQDMADLLNSGADLNGCVATLIETQTDGPLKPVLISIGSELSQGIPLSEAMAMHPAFFDHFHTGMVRSGEASGRLTDTLVNLADQLERNLELREQITTALIYPGVLLAVMCLSLVVILGLILPKFTDLFESFDAELSPTAEVLLALGNFMSNGGKWLLVVCVVSALLAWLFRQRIKPKRLLMSLLHRVPGIRALLDEIAFARFMATLSSLLEAGLQQTIALRVAAEGFSQEHHKQQLQMIITRVNNGLPLGSCFTDIQGIGQRHAQSISNGERAGQLPKALRVLAARLEKDFTRKTQRFVLLLEPILIITLGLIIGLVVYTVFAALQNLGDVPL